MVSPEEEVKPARALRIVKAGGFVILFGILLGISLWIFFLFNRESLILIGISHYEATLFFLGIYLPSFVVIVTVGYIFASGPNLQKLNLWRTTILCALIILCLTLSALSIFNFVSVFGAFLTLTALITCYARPSFKTLWKREGCFFVEAGAIMIASGTILLLLMLGISSFFETYSTGMFEVNASYMYLLLVMVSLSVMTFLITPFLGLDGNNVGTCGIVAMTLGAFSFITATQIQYVYFNPSLYQGSFLLIAGTVLVLFGSLVYFRLSLAAGILAPSLRPSFLYKGKYCPNCGNPWKDSKTDICAICKRSLRWESKPSYCPYCGQPVSPRAESCLHCNKDITSLPVFISLERQQGEGVLARISDRIDFSLRKAVYVCALVLLFAFLSSIAYVRTAPQLGGRFIIYRGLPLECVQVSMIMSSIHTRSPLPPQANLSMESLSIEWVPLVLDFALYLLLALIIVYTIEGLKARSP